jgi:hypothetical protein
MSRIEPRKPDPIFDPTFAGDVNTARVQSAVWRFDQAIAGANAEWGHDRLPYIVSDETRIKWWRNVDALNRAINANDPEKVTAMVDNMVKGLQKLRDEATAAGHAKSDHRTMETALPSGGVLCVVQGWPEHAHRPEPRPNVQVYSIEEIARLIDSQFSLVQKTKALFPDAKVTNARNKYADLNDEVPF